MTLIDKVEFLTSLEKFIPSMLYSICFMILLELGLMIGEPNLWIDHFFKAILILPFAIAFFLGKIIYGGVLQEWELEKTTSEVIKIDNMTKKTVSTIEDLNKMDSEQVKTAITKVAKAIKEMRESNKVSPPLDGQDKQ